MEYTDADIQQVANRFSNEVDPVISALEPATEEEYGYPWRYRPGYWTAMRPIDKICEDIYREFAQSLAVKSLKHGYVMDGPPGDGFAPREVIVPLDAKLAFQEEEL